MVAKTYRELLIWQKAMDLTVIVYQFTEKFPRSELYNLVSQMRRAAISVCSNIAEGFVRKYPREFKQFLSVSLGSLAELETQLMLAFRLGFITDTEQDAVLNQTVHLGRMITKFRQLVN